MGRFYDFLPLRETTRKYLDELTDNELETAKNCSFLLAETCAKAIKGRGGVTLKYLSCIVMLPSPHGVAIPLAPLKVLEELARS